jgi:ribosomal protein L13
MFRTSQVQLRTFRGILRRHKNHPEGLPEYLNMSKQWLSRDGERWWLLDAKGLQLEEVSRLAMRYMAGLHRPDFKPGMIAGDHVVITNIKDIVMVGDQWLRVPVTWQSAYPSGKYRVRSIDMFERDPCMLMFNSIREKVSFHFKQRLKTRVAPLENCWLYEGSVHPHGDKNPRPIPWNSPTKYEAYKPKGQERRWHANQFIQ